MISRPLLITDCDEVLMHMVKPFGAWLSDDHGVDFRLEDARFVGAMRRRATGEALVAEEIWPLLDGFFAGHMHRQYVVDGAAHALATLAELADIVILTNVGPEHADARTRQLAGAGMPYRVIGSRGGKGAPVARLLDELGPSVAAFIDDLPQHHESVGAEAAGVWRLHMVAEPEIAPVIPPSAHAHARIDDWAAALPWLVERLRAGQPAPATEHAPVR